MFETFTNETLNFLQDKITFNNYLEIIKNIKVDSNKIKLFLQDLSHDFKDDDIYMLVCLTSLIIYKDLRSLLKDVQQEYSVLYYLNSIIDEISFKEDITLSEEIYDLYNLYSYSNIYIFINKTNKNIKFNLPSSISNKEVYCVNCGDYIETTSYLDLYPYGFYIIENE